jgi:hypothetical protein
MHMNIHGEGGTLTVKGALLTTLRGYGTGSSGFGKGLVRVHGRAGTQQAILY